LSSAPTSHDEATANVPVVERAAPEELLRFLALLDDEVVEIALALRARVLETLPNLHEVVWDAVNAVTVAYTPTTRWQDGLCHTPAYTKHVNLGFNEGATLPDPRGVLTGSGKHIRHATMRTLADVEAAWIPRYLEAAATQAGVPLDAGDRGLTVKVMAGVKRRPH
jgi:hypothetical protein